MRLPHALLAVIACLLASAGPAGAAAVYGEGGHYWDDRSEVNNLTITRVGDEIQFSDTATINDPGLCAALDEHTVRCPMPNQVRIDLGPGDDVLNDELPSPAGSSHPVVSLSGYHGDGDDVFHGGPSPDTFNASGNDVFSGGGNQDLVTFGDPIARAGVSVSLDGVANDGRPGERGNILPDVEVVYGTPHDDTLVGGPGDDHLNAYEGDNLVVGGPGSDVLQGNRGADHLYGGPGEDYLNGSGEVAGEPRDWLTCGDGLDSAAGVVGGPHPSVFATDCEATNRNGWPPDPSAVPGWVPSVGVPGGSELGTTALRVRVRCKVRSWPCRGRFAVKPLNGRHRGDLGRKRFTIRSPGPKTVRVPLSAAGRRRLRRGLHVVSVVRVTDAQQRTGGTAVQQLVR